MTNEYSQLASGAICFAADMVKIAWQEAAWELMRPAILYKPALSIDGNKWCALYGENLQDGVAGFGDSPQEAMWDFDKAWAKKLSEHSND